MREQDAIRNWKLGKGNVCVRNGVRFYWCPVVVDGHVFCSQECRNLFEEAASAGEK